MINNTHNINLAEENAHASDLSKPTSSTNDWNKLPNEVIEKIITELDLNDILISRKVCKRNVYIVDNSHYIALLKEYYLNIQANKNFFTDRYPDDISLNSILNSFIAFIKKNNLVTKKDLRQINFLVTKLAYHVIQYKLAEVGKNLTHSFKVIRTISGTIFNDTTDIFGLSTDKLALTEDSNTLLYLTNNILHELKIEEGKTAVSKTIFDASLLNSTNTFPFTEQLFSYKQNIAISYAGLHNGTMFFHKIDDSYYNITPKSLYGATCKFIGMQVDPHGDNIFILLSNSAVIFYYMPDYSSNLDATNVAKYNCKSVKISDENFNVYKAQASRTNNLMVICGKNTKLNNDNKMELHIYKHNIKIETLVYLAKEKPSNFFSSPRGNDFTVVEQICKSEINFKFYNITNNKVREVGILSLNAFDYNINSIYYSNNENIIFLLKKGVFYDHLDYKHGILVFLHPKDNIKTINIALGKYYNFNKSGYMFLIGRDNIITIYNLQDNKNITTRAFTCKNIANKAEFSPNSQLLAVREKSGGLGDAEYNTIRIYKLMDLDENNKMQMHSYPKCIFEYRTNRISSFKFHPDGTKLIVSTAHQLGILELVLG